MREPENTTVERPKLFVSCGVPFISILRQAMITARLSGIDEMAMLQDVQSHPEIEDRKKALTKYFEVI